jgi:myo-inositol 2-dehydrogenase/D-chiro-inositol 1-dehydrogenase
MKEVSLGLVGVGRIGAMHARNITGLNELMKPQGTTVNLKLTDVAAEHARSLAGGIGRGVPSVR